MKIHRRFLVAWIALVIAGPAGVPPAAAAETAAAAGKTGAPATAAPAEVASPAAVKAELTRALQLTMTRRLAEAHAIYERCIAAEPRAAQTRIWFAANLSFEAADCKDPAAAVRLRLRAREQALEAQRLGSRDPLIAKLLADLPADGSAPTAVRYSANDEVEQLMQAAEKAFSTGDYARAAQLHQQALAIEPGNYMAALYCGDAYFAQNDYAAAGEWFAKAVAIAPDRETAHRYWANALRNQRKIPEATAQFIEALVAEPYNRMTLERFRQYSQQVGLSSRTASMKLPTAEVKLVGGKPEIQLGAGLDAYAGPLSRIYADACAKFRTDEFARQYPGEKSPRRSLPEESAGLTAMLQFAQETAATAKGRPTAGETARWKPSLDLLAEIRKAGLLEAYVLLERADKDITRDYAAYRAAHRAELRRYIRVYWCGLD